MSVRVRFAPSPTGLLHIGALRTVVYDDLFAKKHGGINILRIEDTDRSRYNPDSEQEFVDTLKWVGIEFNEGPHIGGPNGPYRQSERQALGIYQKWIEQLQADGHAYKAFETSQELDEMREFQQINKQQIGYFGGDWREPIPGKVEAALTEGNPFVVRMKVPRDEQIVVQDPIRGRIEFDSNILPDPVLLKADGMPTYHFAAMVDDHLMGITHILRGEEWISTSPYHWMLFEFFGWERPVFVHCPVIVGADGKKLSKRFGAARVMDYMAMGYLNHALTNFIALIGWSPGDDTEDLTPEEMIAKFSIEGIQPSPGKFDLEKLKWLNGLKMRALSPEELLSEIEALVAHPYFSTYWDNFVDEPIPGQKPVEGKVVKAKLDALATFAKQDRDYVLQVVELERERVHTLVEFGAAAEFFLVENPEMDEKAVEKNLQQAHVPAMFQTFLDRLDATENSPDAYEALIKGYQIEAGFEKIGPVVSPMRIALSGKAAGPGLFDMMATLGKNRIVARLSKWL